MRPTPKQVQLYRTILPSLERAKNEGRSEGFIEPNDIMEELLNAQIFDARQLPLNLVMDTAEAARHEIMQTKKLVRLPYPNCYFEWDHYDGELNLACYASEVMIVDSGRHDDPIIEEYVPDAIPDSYQRILGTIVELKSWMIAERAIAEAREKGSSGFEVLEHWPVNGRFLNGVPANNACQDFTDYTDDSFFALYNICHGSEQRNEALEKARELSLGLASLAILGTLTLLEEKLLINRRQPDPSPRLTASRKQRGRHRLTGPSNILQLDVPAVHRVARPSLAGHESPVLHWRRGHWRVLHRGSEFENKAWVRKCLVGDPTKGFISKSYKLGIGKLPMLDPIEPDLPELIGAPD